MNWFFKFCKSLYEKPIPQPSCSSGPTHNLKEIFDQMNARYFQGRLELSIYWFGRQSKSSRINRKVLGYYDAKNKRIKIHHSLNDPFYPPYFIAYVVYHEMLHSVVPPLLGQKKRQVHHAVFKQKERLFEDYTKAKEWEKENLRKILNGR
ncbi:MAG: hypothetical protein EBZ47_00200 [Chlamydiae bacterium]|nr:hypothetical protein [Chlamydiota bacterium]